MYKNKAKKKFGVTEMEVIPLSSLQSVPSSEDGPSTSNPSTLTIDSHSSVSNDDLDLLIAHRKGTRTCTTKHPLSNFIL